MNATALVVLGDVESFGVPMTIAQDGEFVQVTIAPRFQPARVYALPLTNRRRVAANDIVAHIEEAAALVSTPALVAWLIDCGFSPLT